MGQAWPCVLFAQVSENFADMFTVSGIDTWRLNFDILVRSARARDEVVLCRCAFISVATEWETGQQLLLLCTIMLLSNGSIEFFADGAIYLGVFQLSLCELIIRIVRTARR